MGTDAPKKQLILNAFAMQSPSHLNPGLHRYPGDQGHKYKSLQNWVSLVQKLEAAKFHAIFFAIAVRTRHHGLDPTYASIYESGGFKAFLFGKSMKHALRYQPIRVSNSPNI